MNSSEVLELFRDTVGDIAEPHLWSDKEAYGYMDDAQKQFCRQTGGLGDASSALTQLSYTPDSDWVALDPRILHIVDATDVFGRPIEILNLQDMRKRGMRFSGTPGRVERIVIGIEEHKARLHAFPADDGVIQLTIDRLPLKPITDAGDQKLEIAEHHHQALVMWMQHRAYGKQDAETYDRNKSLTQEALFKSYCFDAKAERERARGKIRVVSYGGI